jgi:hypothetical protein
LRINQGSSTKRNAGRNAGHPQIRPFNLISYTNTELFLQNGRPKRRIARIIGKLMGVHDLMISRLPLEEIAVIYRDVGKQVLARPRLVVEQ